MRCLTTWAAFAKAVQIGLIVRASLPHRRGAGCHRRRGVRDRRKRLVVDLDQLGRVLGLGKRVGDDEGDVVADVAHPVLCEVGLRANEGGGAVFLLARHARRLQRECSDLRIGAEQHAVDSGRRERGRAVDGFDLRVGVRRAQHVAVPEIKPAHVVDVAPAPLQQRNVLFPELRASDGILTHGISPGAFLWLERL
jgi:hypothetical protein